MTEHFTGAPRTDQISSAEVNSACGKVLLRKTLGVEQKQQRKGDDRGYSSSSAVIWICSSSSCFCSTVEGAPIMTS